MKIKKLIIFENVIFDLSKSFILSAVSNIYFNYVFDNRVQKRLSLIFHLQSFVRRVFNLKKRNFRSFNQINFNREKFKLFEFTKQHFVNKFDVFRSKHFILSLLLLTFIDDFELYRNMYRTLMSFYVNIASFSARKRVKRFNVLSLTFESHESNFSNVVIVLQNFYSFDVDQLLKITCDEKEMNIMIYAFIMTFIENMSQQNVNVEIKSQKAKIDCRFCLISEDIREDLNYNIFENERFHHETMRLKNEMKSLNIKSARNQYEKKYELNDEMSSLINISSALNIIRIRSNDSAHSEYEDLTKNLHLLLINAILNVQAQKKYIREFRNFSFFSD